MDGIATITGLNRLEMVTGIILLLDEVILDKQDWLIPAINYAAVKLGMDADRVAQLCDDYISKIGKADSDIYNHILLGCGQSDSVMNIRAFGAWVNRYTPSPKSLYMLPGVLEALKQLRGDYELTLLAEGTVESQRAKIVAMEGSAVFHHVSFSDEIDGKKSHLPDERGLRAAQKMMRSRVTETMFVGVHPRRHFNIPAKQGYITVRCLTGDTASMDYEPNSRTADYNITSAARLPELLGHKNNLESSFNMADFGTEIVQGNKAHA